MHYQTIPSLGAPMLVAVVIPCHHRVDLLAQAVDAVSGWPTWIVDDSVDGSVPALGHARRVRTAGEVGFARAVNAGLEAAQAGGATHVFLLNDDAVPAPGCLQALIAAWGPEVGAAGPLLYGPEGLESAGFDEAWWGRVRQRRTLGAAADPRARALRAGEVQAVSALSGAALLVAASRRLDPGYRHGFEDLALCRDIRREGLEVRLVPGARVLHLGGGTVRRTSRAAQAHAVAGHLRYVGGGWRSGVVVGLALAQVAREGGAVARVAGVVDGIRAWRADRR